LAIHVAVRTACRMNATNQSGRAMRFPNEGVGADNL
jgi:hypothetical protein